MYAESVRGFKSRFYVVRPKTPTGKDILYKWVVDRKKNGTAKKNEDGTDKMKEVERFPMSWTDEHFKKGTESYLTADSSLSEDERQGLRLFLVFVNGFQPGKLVTRTGEPFLDEEGKEQFVPRLINTRRLLECRNRAGVHEVLGGQSLKLYARFMHARFLPVNMFASSFNNFLSPNLTCVFLWFSRYHG
jgi:hypothetical protein